MTLRKKTFDNSVRYIASTNSSQKKILMITNRRLFQIVENKIKTFHKTIIKNYTISEGFEMIK